MDNCISGVLANTRYGGQTTSNSGRVGGRKFSCLQLGVEIQLFSRFLAKGLKENYANLIAEMAVCDSIELSKPGWYK